MTRLTTASGPSRALQVRGSDGAAKMVEDVAADPGLALADEIEMLGRGEDRLGQSARNLFECLAHGGEGTRISLRAGEDPRPLMRPA